MEEDKLNTNYDINKLAYIGDAYFELYTRKILYNRFSNDLSMNDMHKMNTELVCAKSQSKFVDELLINNVFDEKEISIYKSGRNLHTNSKSKNSPVRDYRKATGLEAVLGYLYINNKTSRIKEILSYFNIK